jgi:hypothetical protein
LGGGCTPCFHVYRVDQQQHKVALNIFMCHTKWRGIRFVVDLWFFRTHSFKTV